MADNHNLENWPIWIRIPLGALCIAWGILCMWGESLWNWLRGKIHKDESE